MKEELLKELYESIDQVNKLLVDDELTDFAKQVLIKDEEKKQQNLRAFLTEWNDDERQ